MVVMNLFTSSIKEKNIKPTRSTFTIVVVGTCATAD
jgi:hypothetical protein